MNIVQYDRPFQPLNEGLMKTELVYESQISQPNDIVISPEILENKVENTEVESTQRETLENENKDIDNTDNLSNVLIPSLEQTTINDQEIKEIESAEGLEGQKNDNHNNEINCPNEDEEGKTNETSDFIDGHAELSESIYLDTEPCLNQEETKLNSNENEKSIQGFTETNNDKDLEKDLIKLEIVPSNEALTEDVAAETNEAERVLEENIITTENDQKNFDQVSECNKALKGEQSQPDSFLGIESAKFDDKNVLSDVSPSLAEKETGNDDIVEDKKKDMEAENIDERVSETKAFISKELEKKKDEEEEQSDEHTEPPSQTTETVNPSENLNLNETGVNQESQVTRVKKEYFIEELLLLDQNGTENVSSDKIVEESTDDKENEEDKLEDKIERTVTDPLSQRVESSENQIDDQETVLSENNETINSLSNYRISDLYQATEQLESDVSDSFIISGPEKEVINEEIENGSKNVTNENVHPLIEDNNTYSEAEYTEGLDISNASAIACSIVKEIVDGILAKQYIEEDIPSTIIVRDIIDNIIEKVVSPSQLDDYKDSEKQDEIPVSNQSYENESRIENKEFVPTDKNISEDKEKTVEINKQRRTSETLECVSEYGSSSKTESTLDAKVEGKKMTIVERPKAKERKLSVTSKTSVPSSDLSSASKRKSSIFESEQQKKSNKIDDTKSVLSKEMKRTDKRMSLDLGSKGRKYSLSRKTSEMVLDKRTRRASSSQIVNKHQDIDKSTVEVYEKAMKLEDDKSTKTDTENCEEIKEEMKNEGNESVELFNPIIDLNEEKSSSLTEGMDVKDTQPYEVEIEVQADETTEEIQPECKNDEIDGIKSSDSQRTDLIEKDDNNDQQTQEPILTDDKRFDDKRFEETLENLRRRLSLNQTNSSEEPIALKERSVSVVTKQRPLRKCSTLKELSLQNSEPKIESEKNGEESQESFDITNNQPKENNQTMAEDVDKTKNNNVNTLDEEKQNEENEIKSHLESKSTNEEQVEDRQDTENRSDEENILGNTNLINCEAVKERDNPFELTETTKELKEPETKSQVSSAHTITIEVKGELSEVHEEQDQLQKDGIWIIDNWECSPEMKLEEDGIDHEDERISKEDSTDKPKDENSKALNTEDIKVELRKKMKTSNYNATPVEKYLTKSANQEKVDKPITKDKTPASRYAPKPKEKPNEKIILEANGKALKANEKPKENKPTVLQRKKLKELTFDNIGKKKRKANEDEKMNKSSFTMSNDLELRRIKSNIETLKTEIKKNKQEPKDHVPFIYNDLHPYGDTNMYENFRIKKPMSATGAISRMTAIDLCEPWESFEMDKLILPPIRFKSANIDSKRQNLLRRSYRREKSAIDAKLSHRSDVLKNHSIKERSKSSLQTERRSELHENKPKLSSRRIDDDYQKTKSDLYRLSLDKYDSVTSARSRSNIRKALFAYLQNSPGSRKALYEVIHNIDQERPKKDRIQFSS